MVPQNLYFKHNDVLPKFKNSDGASSEFMNLQIIQNLGQNILKERRGGLLEQMNK